MNECLVPVIFLRARACSASNLLSPALFSLGLHDALLEALQASESRSQELARDRDIAVAEKESALMDAKLTVQRLAHQMRSLVTTKGLEDVYNVMDEDCQRLRRELALTSRGTSGA